jgi:hypothetical protein
MGNCDQNHLRAALSEKIGDGSAMVLSGCSMGSRKVSSGQSFLRGGLFEERVDRFVRVQRRRLDLQNGCKNQPMAYTRAMDEHIVP